MNISFAIPGFSHKVMLAQYQADKILRDAINEANNRIEKRNYHSKEVLKKLKEYQFSLNKLVYSQENKSILVSGHDKMGRSYSHHFKIWIPLE